MSLIEEARQAEQAKQNQLAQRMAQRVRNSVYAHRKIQQEKWGLPITVVDEPLEFATTKSIRSAGWDKRYVHMPVMETVDHSLLVANEVRIIWTSLGTTDQDDYLLRTCKRCSRLGNAGRFAIYLTGEPTPEERKKVFVAELGRKMVKDFLCAFCTADDEALTCPTCNRGFDR